MGMMELLFWPFALVFAGVMVIFFVLFVVLWIWMLVDCAKRNFRNTGEKIIWIVALVFLHWIGIVVYYIVIKSLNPKGLARSNR